MEASPTILRRRMGAKLRKLRELKKLTGEELADLMEWDRTKVYRIEGGKQKIRPKEVRELLGYLDVTDSDTVNEYVEMAKQTNVKGWWAAYGPLPKYYGTYVGLETEATEIRSWEPYVVNGLLQTESYARAIISKSSMGMPDNEVERQVQIRLERQKRTRGIPVLSILDESILHRVIGDRQILRDQLAHLIDLASQPGYSVRILPFNEGGHLGGRGAITVMTLEEGPVTYVDTPAGQIYPEGEQAKACSLALDHLHEKALSLETSVGLIESAKAKLSAHA